MSAPRILCIINEDWFFQSHFLSWARAARAAGFEVVLLAARGAASERIEAEGIRVVAAKAARAGLAPKNLVPAARQAIGLIDPARPTIVHAFGLHGMAIAALARTLQGRFPAVVSVTGLGFLAASGRKLAAGALAFAARTALDGPATVWLTENPSDGPAMGLSRAGRNGRIIQLGGAGVDVAAFSSRPSLPRPPLKLALVARMIRSKGVDLAVAAVTEARRRGLDVSLTLVGAGDPRNPRAYTAAELAGFATTEGVTMLGARDDVARILGEHHAFILPSRGGEGLPKALLEAAAGGLPAVVTDVPGCREFVVDGATGFVVPADNVRALADALVRLAASDVDAMGLKARARVVDGYSVETVSAAVVEVYRRLAAKAARHH
ncbi:MAG: glycosyltransferase [Rhizobiales bacterium]|nr:glycosyltransferase [Hyphomicrobiales bacterium]